MMFKKRLAAGSVVIATAALLMGGSPAIQPLAGSQTTNQRISALESRMTLLEARVTALEGQSSASPTVGPTLGPPSPSPTLAPTPTPTAVPSSVAGWTLVWNDEFTTWDPSKYFIYGDSADGAGGYRDTQEQSIAGTGGFYSPNAYSVSNGTLRIHLYTDSSGIPRVGAFIPQIGGTANGDLPSMTYEFVIRADRMVGYKGVPLLWPDSGAWPRDGEINWPESNFDARPSGFVHYQDAIKSDEQAYFTAPTGTSWQDRHKYRLEWISGTSVKAYLDDVLIATVTSRIPNTPMHLVMQFETDLADTRPDPSVNGYVEVDYLKVWKLAA